IKACWASLPSPSILGYSGGGTLSRDFAGAPLTNTWYTASLANSLYGSDLDPANEDVHITYNTNFSWYTGLDANPPGGTYDLVTVATHEIGHGLNFAGSAIQSGATGSYGYGTGYPNVYDTFMRNYSGTLLINYTNPSAALGTLLTSGSLWFHGTNAMAANGSSRVKMYAPPTWATGSSYSHLDYATFAGTINSMMVYAIPSSTANHNTGPITRGLLQDLGWASGPTYNNFLPIILNGGNSSLTDPILNGNFEAGHSSWIEYSANVWPLIVSSAPVTAHGGSWLTWLGGGDNETSRLSQSVLIPPGLSILHYWYWSSSVETVCTYDYFRLKVNGSSQLTTGLCTASNTGAWVERAIDLSAFAGLTVTLMFDVTTDNSKISSFFLDDVSLEATTRISESILIDGINDSSTMRK
ncbi:MAG: immune inhibitor A, partial [Anaerolineales bacterium]|nr:immune inhibitor A [Anaerolineales bacterium]